MINEPLRNNFYGNTPHTYIMCPSRESNQGPTGYYVYASPIIRIRSFCSQLAQPAGGKGAIRSLASEEKIKKKNTDTKLQQKLRKRAKQKEQRKIARLQNPRLNTHDKDEMS